MRFGKTSVSLNLRNPFKAGNGSTSVFVLYPSGQHTLNRGYLIEGGMAPDSVQPALDEQIRLRFPAARWGEKGYYITLPLPDPAAVHAFTQSLQHHLAELTQRTSAPAGRTHADGDDEHPDTSAMGST